MAIRIKEGQHTMFLTIGSDGEYSGSDSTKSKYPAKYEPVKFPPLPLGEGWGERMSLPQGALRVAGQEQLFRSAFVTPAIESPPPAT